MGRVFYQHRNDKPMIKSKTIGKAILIIYYQQITVAPQTYLVQRPTAEEVDGSFGTLSYVLSLLIPNYFTNNLPL